MSNALTIAQGQIGVLSTKFAGVPASNDLGAGIAGGFGRIGYKGKVWSTNYRGEQKLLLDNNGDPIPSIEMVIIKASPVISKTWYEAGYVEGSVAPPDCLSSNGLTPDVGAPKKQSATCALCPKNAWGSQIKQDGTAGKGKACSDTKRLAVVPLPDINNELLGGPMLLRVPAASLNDTATYGAQLAKLGYPEYGVGTRVGFDPAESFPKFVYRPIRALTDAEADMVLAHRADPRIDRILAEEAPVSAPVTPGVTFEQAPPAQAPAPVQSPQQVAVTHPHAPAPAPQASAGFGVPSAQVTVTAPAVVPPKPATTRKPRAASPAPAATTTPAATGFGGAPAPAVAAAQPPGGLEVAPANEDFDAQLDSKLDALMAN